MNDGMTRCAHGFPVTDRITDAKGWTFDYVSTCQQCAGEPCGIPYKLSVPAPAPAVPPPPPPTELHPQRDAHLDDLCAVCGELILPGAVAIPTEDGRQRHAIGSPTCGRSRRASSPEVESLPGPCPTCGRPVADDLLYDIPALRKALHDALAALDTLERCGEPVEDDGDT